ncbi:MAG: LpxI family protein [Planctomycetota bacterium]|nr:MAG: LpxI family protein [Planctomycetota bacterium]
MNTGGNAPIGLVAGWGRFPIVVAEELKRRGECVVCVGVRGHADTVLADICDAFYWIGLGQLGRAIRLLKRHGVRRATMAGKIHKVVLFRRWAWIRHLPDWRAVKAFAPHFLTRKKDNRDDSLLTTLCDEFAADGISFEPATDLVPKLLIGRGILTRTKPNAWQQKDIAFGWRMAKEMGRLDIGQSVVVKDLAVLAVEAVEGTDACIRRAGELCEAGGFTVVKVAKPQQDMRFDVPTIGTSTLQTILEAGGRTLAVEAGKTILLDAEDVLRFADKHDMILVALTEDDLVSADNAELRDASAAGQSR